MGRNSIGRLNGTGSVLGWGIIGRAADTLVVPGISNDPNSSLVHVVSRDAGRGKAFADKHGAVRSGTDFEAMPADPDGH